jgi:transcriptional antiterminator NusG
MNEFEQKAPEQTDATAPTVGAAEEQPLAVEPTTEPALDITMGDMETDLPAASSDTAAPAEEMEIPWDDMTVPSEVGGQEVEAVAEQPTETVAEAETPSEAEGEEKPQIKRVWYVVHCYSGYENKVKKGLEQRINSMGLQDYIFRVVVPVEREVEIREGQRKNIERRVFPGYILVEMMELVDRETLSADAPPSLQKLAAISDEVWYAVRNTPGVTGFVSSGDQQRPVPLRQEEVDKILKRMESEEPKVHVTFRVGQTVHIIDGPFADFRGNVDAVDMLKGKVRVLVSFFGRETPVELDLLQVEKV